MPLEQPCVQCANSWTGEQFLLKERKAKVRVKSTVGFKHAHTGTKPTTSDDEDVYHGHQTNWSSQVRQSGHKCKLPTSQWQGTRHMTPLYNGTCNTICTSGIVKRPPQAPEAGHQKGSRTSAGCRRLVRPVVPRVVGARRAAGFVIHQAVACLDEPARVASRERARTSGLHAPAHAIPIACSHTET